MSGQERETCMSCTHRHENQCRRFPPQVSVVVVPRQNIAGQIEPSLQIQGAWPLADDQSWCGEWAGKFRLAS